MEVGRSVDHFADSVFAEPGGCWRLVTDFAARPTHCTEQIVVEGRTRLSGWNGRAAAGAELRGAPGGARAAGRWHQ